MGCLDRELDLLTQAAGDEVTSAPGEGPVRSVKPAGGQSERSAQEANPIEASEPPLRWGVSRAACPGRGEVKLWKVLQTNACELNCKYCAFGKSRNIRRATATPEDMAKRFMELSEAGLADGLFLSSGILGGADRSMERIVATAEILRKRRRYRGYIHLKIMPGSSYAAVEAAAAYADRLSMNLEGVSPQHLCQLAPHKRFEEELLQGIADVHKAIAATNRRVDHVTQFVVGPAGESDRKLLQTASWMYGSFGVRRAYYSRFRPVSETPFEGLPETLPVREHRLYQADWMIRDYEFTAQELPFDEEGQLPLLVDPKTAYAAAHPENFPLEINTASRGELLRVPGLGKVSVKKILTARRSGRIHDLFALPLPPYVLRQCAPFLICNGKAAVRDKPPAALQRLQERRWVGQPRRREPTLEEILTATAEMPGATHPPLQTSLFSCLEESHDSQRRRIA